MDNLSIAVDIDEVCANLIGEWIRLYNNDYNDNLKESDITDWDISKFVKPECGKKIYSYIKMRSIYDNVYPINGAKEGIKKLKNLGYRTFYATSTPIETAGVKYAWLKKNGFEVSQEDYMEVGDKSLIHASYLIDDRFENISKFKGKGILFNSPWNKKYPYKDRVNNWDDIINIFSGKDNNSLW